MDRKKIETVKNSNGNKNDITSVLKRAKFKHVMAWVIVCLAAAIGLGTFIRLMQPAVAMTKTERVLECSFEVHQHTEDCYTLLPVYDEAGNQTGTERVLTCGKADYAVHVHNDDCFRTETLTDENGEILKDENGEELTRRILVCALPEIREHKHTAECYAEYRYLACGKEETSGHLHTEECYEEVQGELTCEKAEHTHSEACYGDVVTGTESVLSCGLEEGAPEGSHTETRTESHTEYRTVTREEVKTVTRIDEATGAEITEEVTELVEAQEPYEVTEEITEEVIDYHHHTENCYKIVELTERQLTCGLEEHTHDEACYAKEQVLACGKEEGEGSHSHTEACWQTEQQAVCGQLELHTHTEECYEKGANGESPEAMGWIWYTTDEHGNRVLEGMYEHRICGLPELLEHRHGSECIKTVQVVVEEETTEEETSEAETAEAEVTAEEETIEAEVTAEEEITEAEMTAEEETTDAAEVEETEATEAEESEAEEFASEELATDESAIEELETEELETEAFETEELETEEFVTEFVTEEVETEEFETEELETEEVETEEVETEKFETEELETEEVETEELEAEKLETEEVETEEFETEELETEELETEELETEEIETEEFETEEIETEEETSEEAEEITSLSKDGLTISALGSALPEGASLNFKVLSEDSAAGAREALMSFLAGKNSVKLLTSAFTAEPEPAAPLQSMKKVSKLSAGKGIGLMSASLGESVNPEAAEQTDNSASAQTVDGAQAGGQNAEQAGEIADAENSKPASETRYQFFDISLDYDTEGEKTAYNEGFEVSVQLPEAITGRDFHLYHIHEEEDGSQSVSELTGENFTLINADGTAAAEDGTDNTGSTAAQTIEGFSFITDNFSVFVLEYTVDFEYTDEETGKTYAYTLTGGEDMLLSMLLEALEIQADLTGSAVRFTDETLFSFTPVTDDEGIVRDWLITSLIPFDTEEELVVTLANGTEITIAVTDDQIVTYVIDSTGDTWSVTVEYEKEAGIPEDSVLEVKEITEEDEAYAAYVAAASEALLTEENNRVISGAKLFDITIMHDGQKVIPAAPVKVCIEFVPMETEESGSAVLLHYIDEEGNEENNADNNAAGFVGVPDIIENPEFSQDETQVSGVVFEAEGFSVYGVVYTVDFEYSVNGKMYQFSLPGGGFVSFTDLVEVLGISGGTNSEENEDKNDSEIAENAEENAVNTGVEENGVNADTNATLTLSDVEVSEATRKFVVDVASVEFSSPELVDVSKVDADTTVGQIKESRGLDVEYSAELTEEQIAEINAQTVETGDWALISLQSFVSEETLTVTMKNGEVFTIQVTDPRITAMYLSDNGDLYEVTVIYDENANIPEGSSLRVTEFAENSEKYDYARNSVLADKKARDEQVDLGSFALAALDISILNPAGEEIEPEAPVQVEIRIKELPGVEDLSEVADTLAIQHHVEVEDGVVVETVFDGSTQASFKLETNETVAAEGIAVDPNSVSEEDFAPSNVTPLDFEAIEGVNGFQTNKKTITFEVKAFSTFTVTWLKDRDSSNSTMNLRWTSGYGYYATTYSNLTLHYFDTAGNPITSPLGDQTVSNGQNVSVTTGNYTNIPGYQFDHAWVWVDQSQGRYIPLDTVNFRFSIDNYWLGNYYYRSTPTIYIQQNGNNLIYGQYVNNQTFSNDVYLYFRKVSGDTLSATIHYVDEAGNELAVSNGQPVNDTYEQIVSWYWSEEDQDYTIPAERWYFNSLIYDVEGYEYAYTYRNAEENRITPILNYRGDSWKYTSGEETYGPSNTWTNLSDKDDIYVVYKKKSDVSTGGTPEPKITGEKPETPTITKESVVNGDGTNTLSLSVTGHTSVMEAEKLADVIVVYDVSGSMNFRMDSETEAVDGERRMDYAQTATKALAESLLGKNTTEHPNLIRMSLISFSNTAEKRQGFTTDLTTFNDAVTSLPSPDGGTNWEYALQLANEMAVESDRATFVIFVTDGNPTFRQTRGVLNNGGEGGIGDEDVSGNYFNYNVYGTGYSDKHGRNYAAALKQAQSIVSHNKNFYTIGISDDVTNLTKLTTQAGAGADHSKTATSNDALVAAFNEIAASIIAYLGHSDVQITDGITDLTQTVQKSDLVNFKEDDFTYYKERLATEEEISDSTKIPEGAVIETRDGVKYTVWNDWDPTSEGCAKAVYNTTTKAVEWNMGESFMLEDGCTYQVRFKVWPSQKAYDLLADLNNGKKSYDSLTDAEKAQISEPTEAGGMYTLKTNSETSYTYREATKSGDTVTPTGDPSKPGSFPDVDPLELTTKPLKVQKLWHNNYAANVETVESITLELYDINASGQERQTFKTITLTGDEVTDENDVTRTWYSANNYISYGLITLDKDHPAADTRKVYETGHDFTLREVGINAHYFELTSGIFRPMVINGTPTVLQRADDGVPAGMSESAFYYTDGTHEYYRIDGHVYVDTQSDIVLIATNSRRSYMDLKKEVVDESRDAVVDDTEFEYKITFTVPPTIDNYETVEKYIWFSVYDSVARRTLSPSEYTCTGVITPAQENAELFSGAEYANYLVAISGQKVTLKIKQGWNVRFLNLANGTIYSFTETNIPDGYSFVKAEVSGTRWIANMVNGEDKGSAVTMTGLPSNNSGSNTETVISGTIQFANARYSTTYTNKTLTRKVNILKTSQDGVTPLSGAVFSLYTESGYEADPRKASKTDLASDEDGKIEIGGLAYGKYYLVETAAPEGYVPLSDPVEITVNGSGVTYVQRNSTLSQSNKGISYNQETEVYTLTVTNNAGYELPATGGPGTNLIYLFGIMLTGLAGAGLVMRRKRKAA